MAEPMNDTLLSADLRFWATRLDAIGWKIAARKMRAAADALDAYARGVFDN
jgi:hypothetical protein